MKWECTRKDNTPDTTFTVYEAEKMAITNDSYADELNQIRDKQVAVLDEIDLIHKRHGVLPTEIEQIQSDALSIVYEIEQIVNRREGELDARPFLPPHAFPKLPATAIAGGQR